MALWVILDDSLDTDELLAGAGPAAIAALVTELATYQRRGQAVCLQFRGSGHPGLQTNAGGRS